MLDDFQFKRFAAYGNTWVPHLNEASLFVHRTESLLERNINDITSPPDCLFMRATHQHHAARRALYPKMIVASSLTSCPASDVLGFSCQYPGPPRLKGFVSGQLNPESTQAARKSRTWLVRLLRL